MSEQKVQLDAQTSAPVVSRPLKTGAKFVLVLPRHRFIYRHWDKEKYLPGEEGELILEGEGLPHQKLEFVVERADSEAGPWLPVKTLSAEVQGEKATAKFTFPKDEPQGHLTRAVWKRARARPGERLGMHVEASGYEGGWLEFVVERQDENGEWKPYTRWQGNIEDGHADTVFAIPPMPAGPTQDPGARVVEVEFDGEPEAGGVAWLLARTERLDSEQLQFILERADENGDWHELGEGVGIVKDGEARNAIPVPLAAGEAAGLVPARFSRPLYGRAEELVVYVDPDWLKGEEFEVTLERRVLVDEQQWSEVAAVDAEPVSNDSGGDTGDGGADGDAGDGDSGGGGTGAGGSGGIGPAGGVAAAGVGGGVPAGLSIGGIAAGAGAVAAAVAAGVSAAADAKEDAGDAEKNGADSAQVEE